MPKACNGAPDRIRTYDPNFRKVVLYPTELRVQKLFLNHASGARVRYGTCRNATCGNFCRTRVLSDSTVPALVPELRNYSNLSLP